MSTQIQWIPNRTAEKIAELSESVAASLEGKRPESLTREEALPFRTGGAFIPKVRGESGDV
uniref:Uncharacterized protein n=1 Tax=Leersia perrieri TaxID=77586 RepID=A0A0D9VNB3_9ORYZ